MASSKISEFPSQDSELRVDLQPDFSNQESIGLPSADVLAQVLDSLSAAVLVTEKDASVLHVNQRAQNILKSRTGLFVAHGALKAGSAFETAKLKSLIKKAAINANAEDPKEQSRHFGMVLGEGAESGIQSVVISGLRANGQEGRTKGGHAVLFVADRDDDERIPPTVLHQLFGLTSSESAVASQLTEGRGLEFAANKCAMGINTARTHLKMVFRKTQTNRQAELVRLLLKTAGLVRFD